jgi:hypothetical protein
MQNGSLTLEQLRERVAARNLAPAKLLPVGQLRIATIPSQTLIAACRNRPPLSDAQLAEFARPLPVGQQRIAVMPNTPISGEPNISPEQLAQWGRPIIGHPDGSVNYL